MVLDQQLNIFLENGTIIPPFPKHLQNFCWITDMTDGNSRASDFDFPIVENVLFTPNYFQA